MTLHQRSASKSPSCNHCVPASTGTLLCFQGRASLLPRRAPVQMGPDRSTRVMDRYSVFLKAISQSMAVVCLPTDSGRRGQVSLWGLETSTESISLRNPSLRVGFGEAADHNGRAAPRGAVAVPRPGGWGPPQGAVLEWMEPERGGCRAGRRAQQTQEMWAWYGGPAY